MSLTRRNNFDLLRLFAAYQVVFFHCSAFWKFSSDSNILPIIQQVYSFFPGLPTFFIISGFLVSSSWEKNQGNLRSYAGSRFLRIYPGLWVALSIFFIVGVSKYWSITQVSLSTVFLWFLAQMSFFQNWIPSFLRNSVAGGFYGVLWTISVELTFYALLPILYHFVIDKFMSRWAQNACLIIIGFLSFWAHVSYTQIIGWLNLIAPFPPKLLFYTFLPHLWLFILGLLAWRNFDRIKRFVEGKFALWSLLFIILNYGLQFVYRSMGYLPEMLYNYQDMISPTHWLYDTSFALIRVTLAFWILSTAFSIPGLATKILRGQDISYGVYLYHPFLIILMV